MEWTDRCTESRSQRKMTSNMYIWHLSFCPSTQRPLPFCTHTHTLVQESIGKGRTSQVKVWSGRKVTTTTQTRAASCLRPDIQTIRAVWLRVWRRNPTPLLRSRPVGRSPRDSRQLLELCWSMYRRWTDEGRAVCVCVRVCTANYGDFTIVLDVVQP